MRVVVRYLLECIILLAVLTIVVGFGVFFGLSGSVWVVSHLNH